MTVVRDRPDRCPGALRPWPAEDGLLVRLRLIGGRVNAASLLSLAELAERFGDGRVRVTGRANLQVRGLPGVGGRLADEVLAALDGTGLLPSTSHELVRNVMMSPLTGISGGRGDLRPLAAELDALLCAIPNLAELPARFLFVLDDGRGDLVDRGCDLGLVALDERVGQVRVGDSWGEVIPLPSAASHLIRLAETFLRARGVGPTAAWHVVELGQPLAPTSVADPRLPAPAEPMPFGAVPGGEHVPVPETGLDLAVAATLAGRADTLVVTPWRGILIPDEGSHV